MEIYNTRVYCSKEEVYAITEILKKRFNNLSTTILLEISYEILEAVAKANNKDNNVEATK